MFIYKFFCLKHFFLFNTLSVSNNLCLKILIFYEKYYYYLALIYLLTKKIIHPFKLFYLKNPKRRMYVSKKEESSLATNSLYLYNDIVLLENPNI